MTYRELMLGTTRDRVLTVAAVMLITIVLIGGIFVAKAVADNASAKGIQQDEETLAAVIRTQNINKCYEQKTKTTHMFLDVFANARGERFAVAGTAPYEACQKQFKR